MGRAKAFKRVAVSVLTVLMVSASLVGCKVNGKEVATITAKGFINEVEEQSNWNVYVSEDTDDTHEGILANAHDGNLQVFYDRYEQATQASNEYQTYINKIETLVKSKKTLETSDTQSFAGTSSDGTYYYVRRIANTVVFGAVAEENKDEMISFLKNIGY